MGKYESGPRAPETVSDGCRPLELNHAIESISAHYD
jgi:hypothetical protein